MSNAMPMPTYVFYIRVICILFIINKLNKFTLA
jgi:hypothetical protein